MCCSMDCLGVLDENVNYIIITTNGLNEREKGENSFQLEKKYIDLFHVENSF